MYVAVNGIAYLLIWVSFIGIKEYVTLLSSKGYRMDKTYFTYKVWKDKL